MEDKLTSEENTAIPMAMAIEEEEDNLHGHLHNNSSKNNNNISSNRYLDQKRFVIGYGLLQKKQRSFVQPSLVSMAKSHGVDLVPIDLHRPLADQGPFHAIIHKLSGFHGWNQQLATYSVSHPDVLIIDSPSSIERLNNRITMLQVVSDLIQASSTQIDSNGQARNEDEESAFVSVPKQCVLLGNADADTADVNDGVHKVAIAAGLEFPVIAKPLVVDGSTDSHSMLLAFNPESLAKVKPPMVIQEFINHGSVIFKVYVVGSHVRCVRRASLPDIDITENANSREPLSFCQISNTNILSTDLQKTDLPPEKFLSHVASGLRKALGLRLFNFDIIRDAKCKNHYYVIDINYFPGYAKMPDYEVALTNFFVSLAEEHHASS